MRGSPDVSQHLVDEGQQFLQRVEMGGLPGHYMFYPPLNPPLRNFSAQAKVHDKRPMD